MALSIFVETLDNVDEPLREHYVECDGGFILEGVENDQGYGIGNIKKLTTALNSVRKDNDALNGKLKVFSDLDPEEARKAIEKQKEWDEKNINKDKEFSERLEAQKKKLVELHTQEQGKLQTDNSKLRKEINRLVVDNDATSELTTRERKGDPRLLLPHIRGRVRVVEADGKFTKQILDESGEPELDSLGNPITSMKYLIDKLEKEFPMAFEGNDSTGTGGGGTGGGGGVPKTGTIKRSEFEKLSPDAQMKKTSEGWKIID